MPGQPLQARRVGPVEHHRTDDAPEAVSDLGGLICRTAAHQDSGEDQQEQANGNLADHQGITQARRLEPDEFSTEGAHQGHPRCLQRRRQS